MSAVLRRATPIELSADRRFAGRVRRLAATAVVALGLIWALAVTTLDAPPLVGLALAGGWLLMPTILFASLTWPVARYALVVPASLVGLALLAIGWAWLPDDPDRGFGLAADDRRNPPVFASAVVADRRPRGAHRDGDPPGCVPAPGLTEMAGNVEPGGRPPSRCD